MVNQRKLVFVSFLFSFLILSQSFLVFAAEAESVNKNEEKDSCEMPNHKKGFIGVINGVVEIWSASNGFFCKIKLTFRLIGSSLSNLF